MTATNKPVTFLIGSQSSPTALLLQESLMRLFNAKVLTAWTGQEALAVLEQRPINLLIADSYISDMSGLSLVRQVRCRQPGVAIIMLAGHLSSWLRNQAAQLSIRHILIRPIGLLQLREAVLDLLQAQAIAAGLEFNQAAVLLQNSDITQAMECWIRQQIDDSRPDLQTRELLELLDQWHFEGRG